MQPDTLTFERAVGDHNKNKWENESDWIEDICVILSQGDITRRDDILWGYTLAECEPYLRACIRGITFREAVLAFLGMNPPSISLQRGRKGEEIKNQSVNIARGKTWLNVKSILENL